jgi:formylglycine-generating enzyme required for sulfatase activity
MVYLKGATFRMGTSHGTAAEGPVHEVTLKGFWMDRHEVTNLAFERFVEATGYRTEAEKIGWSGVFDTAERRWIPVSGADWRHPEGPSSDLRGRMKHPVVHVSWNDAAAYAKWAGKRLPTEAEFELAARGGLAQKEYASGDVFEPQGRPLANVWQGRFPERDLGRDGFRGTAPVGSFPPNALGIYDLAGNVWEWCADWFGADYYSKSPRANPTGPPRGTERVLRGGSWMCSDNFCRGYRTAARNKSEPDSGLNNTGFRCVKDAPAPR